MRNKLPSIILICNCNCMFPTKCNIYNKIVCSHSKHFCCFKFSAFFNITMKCTFRMASDAQSHITICWCLHWVFIFFNQLTKLTLFPIFSTTFESNFWIFHIYHPSIILMKLLSEDIILSSSEVKSLSIAKNSP